MPTTKTHVSALRKGDRFRWPSLKGETAPPSLYEVLSVDSDYFTYRKLDASLDMRMTRTTDIMVIVVTDDPPPSTGLDTAKVGDTVIASSWMLLPVTGVTDRSVVVLSGSGEFCIAKTNPNYRLAPPWQPITTDTNLAVGTKVRCVISSTVVKEIEVRDVLPGKGDRTWYLLTGEGQNPLLRTINQLADCWQYLPNS